MSARPAIETCADPDALAGRAAWRFAEAARTAIQARGRFAVALPGGSTPRPVFERLAGPPHVDAVPWERIEWFWTDERCVGPDRPESNYGMAKAALLDRVPVDPARVHRMRGEDPDPDAAAAAYAGELQAALGGPAGGPPRLDLALLGLGPDGHTASLFPGAEAIDAAGFAAAVPAAGTLPPRVDRITLTPAALNAAREVTFLVAGPSKADAVRAVLEGPRDPHRWPAQAIVPSPGRARWLLDAAAAARLDDLGRPAGA